MSPLLISDLDAVHRAMLAARHLLVNAKQQASHSSERSRRIYIGQAAALLKTAAEDLQAVSMMVGAASIAAEREQTGKGKR